MLRRITPAAWLGAFAMLVPTPLAAHSAALAGTGARVVAEAPVASRTVDLTIDSPAVDGRRKVRLLLP
ncbi:MAG TPA: hypothetical protein VHA75_06875, partial [Rugosimonospora sp.]|nr:hypothetical protein [Rugosimonospora sp.]